ncbi:MAG: glycosyltransferase [Terrimicrobiaceae bacterium]
MPNQTSPRFSVIVPAPSIEPSPAVLDLETLGEPWYPEVLIATGSNPSRQRNLAAAKACGEWLVFLDSDCRLEADYFDRLATHAERGLEIVGGPVLLFAGASPLEATFQSLLGHPLLTGASSARYESRGTLRRCDDAQLILCNLAVRRDLFLKFSGFEERLYPNEENEWLSRMDASGVACWHDPQLTVRRPQRKSWRAYARMLTGYGRGRTRQFMLSGKWDASRQLPALALLAWLAFFAFRPRVAAKASFVMWLGLGAACLAFPSRPGIRRLPAAAALIAPSAPLLYAVGQIAEFLVPGPRTPAGEVRVYRWEPKSRTLVPAT